MSVLESGEYTVRQQKKVVVWRAPDAQGDGDYVTEPDVIEGTVVGTRRVKDRYGNEVRYYSPPEGFENVPNSDRKDCYVLVDDRKNIVRQPDGQAVNIRPGCALVFEPDGSVTELVGELAQYYFAQGHDVVGSSDVESSDVEEETVDNG